MPEQQDKCFEHHMLLKRELEDFKKEFDDLTKSCRDMHCFFFGGINQADGHISFVDKVNSLYESQQNTRKFYNTFLSVFGCLIVTGLVSLGMACHSFQVTSDAVANLTKIMENTQSENMEIKVELAQLKAKVGHE